MPGEIRCGSAGEASGESSEEKPKFHYAVHLALYTDILERKEKAIGRTSFVRDVRGRENVLRPRVSCGERKPKPLG